MRLKGGSHFVLTYPSRRTYFAAWYNETSSTRGNKQVKNISYCWTPHLMHLPRGRGKVTLWLKPLLWVFEFEGWALWQWMKPSAHCLASAGGVQVSLSHGFDPSLDLCNPGSVPGCCRSLHDTGLPYPSHVSKSNLSHKLQIQPNSAPAFAPTLH